MDKKELKKFLIVMIILIILFLISFIVYKVTMTSNKNVNDIIEEKGNIILFINNSDNEKCRKCNDMKKVLDNMDVEYYNYDLSKNNDYDEILVKLELNSNMLSAPSILVIEDGKVSDGLMNLTDKSILKDYIKNNNLGK